MKSLLILAFSLVTFATAEAPSTAMQKACHDNPNMLICAR